MFWRNLEWIISTLFWRTSKLYDILLTILLLFTVFFFFVSCSRTLCRSIRMTFFQLSLSVHTCLPPLTPFQCETPLCWGNAPFAMPRLTSSIFTTTALLVQTPWIHWVLLLWDIQKWYRFLNENIDLYRC